MAEDPYIQFIANFFTKREKVPAKERIPDALICVSSGDGEGADQVSSSAEGKRKYLT